LSRVFVNEAFWEPPGLARARVSARVQCKLKIQIKLTFKKNKDNIGGVMKGFLCRRI